eukprot:m.108723 g.108723  ORF g.108723 m.108723 type:complete len:115 (-) comp12818_c0_seq3:199-543(-)
MTGCTRVHSNVEPRRHRSDRRRETEDVTRCIEFSANDTTVNASCRVINLASAAIRSALATRFANMSRSRAPPQQHAKQEHKRSVKKSLVQHKGATCQSGNMPTKAPGMKFKGYK